MKILVVGPSWVGDMVMSNSLYQELKQRYPNCVIDVLAPEWCKPLLDLMPEVNRAISMPIGHGEFALSKRKALGRQLSSIYDLAIVLPKSFKSALIPLFADIKVRRGWIGESRYGLLTDWRKAMKSYPMMVQRYVALAYDKKNMPVASALTYPEPRLQVNINEKEQTLIKFKEQLSTLQERAIIGLCPGAEFGAVKRWPDYHYATLARVLLELDFSIAIFGSDKDKAIAEAIMNRIPDEIRKHCINFAGSTKLKEAVELIDTCDAIVSNDSGLMHITAALNKPLIALYGPTTIEYAPPLSKNASSIRIIDGPNLTRECRKQGKTEQYHSSLINIQPKQVLIKLLELLDK